jgi:hypothetical protein
MPGPPGPFAADRLDAQCAAGLVADPPLAEAQAAPAARRCGAGAGDRWGQRLALAALRLERRGEPLLSHDHVFGLAALGLGARVVDVQGRRARAGRLREEIAASIDTLPRRRCAMRARPRGLDGGGSRQCEGDPDEAGDAGRGRETS